MRKLVYHVAATVDGFISRADGSFDFFPTEGEHIPDYVESLSSYGDVLMGRKTYEVGLRMGVTDPYPMLRSFVFSRSMVESPNPQVRVVSEDVTTFVAALKREEGKPIYLCGGADLARQLLVAGLVDEVKLKLNPVVLGAGIPLFGEIPAPVNLRLDATKVYESGVVLLTYSVR